MPKMGPKNEPIVSIKDRIPIRLSKGNKKIPIKKPNKAIITPELLRPSLSGI